MDLGTDPGTRERMTPHGELFIWMQLLGLDREASDYGVGEWLKRIGRTPDGVCLFLVHPDIIHQHDGMEKEFGLHPDNCAYAAIPRNILRARQPWTNYDLRGAVRELKKAGVPPYLSIQGAHYNNLYHREWITDHPEIQHYITNGQRHGICPLKRFADGTWYEDFFIEKLCRCLQDYGFDGIQLADGFCPAGMTHNADFSADLVDQFLSDTGITPPAEILGSMGNDDAASVRLRGEWIWKHMRAPWILFLNRRWEAFFRKLCAAVHAIGKKVIALAVYCTDPFETLYCNGIDLKRIADAGVDYLMPNTLPTSVHFNGRAERFWRYMTTVSLNAAFLNGTKQLCMLGVKDSTEEWDSMQDTPCLFQRDMYTILAQQLITPDGCRRAADGIMICLGDAIEESEWATLRKHFPVAFTHDVSQLLTPAVLWSDEAFYNTLPAVIGSGRWSTHRFLYEAAKRGAPCGGAVRTGALSRASGTLFVPNFDLLGDAEKAAVAAYAGGPVVGTVPAGFDLSACDIRPVTAFTDETAAFPMTAFAFGAELSDAVRSGIAERLARPDTCPEPPCPIDAVPDWGTTLAETIPFIRHASGFLDALAYLLYHADDARMPLSAEGAVRAARYERCDCPFILLRLQNGKYRMFLYNPERDRYRPVNVNARKRILDAQVVSFYPILPVKYNNTSTGQAYIYNYDGSSPADYDFRSFSTKIRPGGITVVDVTLEGDEDARADR